MVINTYLSITTLNVNGLNAPIKRHRVSECMEKQDPSICCLQETHFRPKDICRLKVRGWRNFYHASGCQKKDGTAIRILDKRNLKTGYNERQRRTLYNHEGNNLTRRYNNYKYLCTQHGSTQVHKIVINIKELIDSRGL